jgi:hypothetical protein
MADIKGSHAPPPLYGHVCIAACFTCTGPLLGISFGTNILCALTTLSTYTKATEAVLHSQCLAVIQEALQQRVAAFADGSAPPMHHARATLPARVAMLLAREPQLAAPAVDAFYNRDLAAMKASTKCIRISIYTVPAQCQCHGADAYAGSLLHMMQWGAHDIMVKHYVL